MYTSGPASCRGNVVFQTERAEAGRPFPVAGIGRKWSTGRRRGDGADGHYNRIVGTRTNREADPRGWDGFRQIGRAHWQSGWQGFTIGYSVNSTFTFSPARPVTFLVWLTLPSAVTQTAFTS